MSLRNLILKEWFRFFIGAFLALTLLITVAELISGFLRSNVTATEVVLNHIVEITNKFKLITPVSCLMASLFAINKLKNRNELTAIFAAGYSRKRFFKDILIGAMIISCAQFFISGFLEPYTKSKKDFFIEDGQSKFKNLKSEGLMASTIESGRLWFKSQRYFFSFSSFDKKLDQLNDVAIFFINSDNLLSKKITAKTLRYIGDAWIGRDVVEIDRLAEKVFPAISRSNDYPIAILETPADFKEIEADITTLNVFDLYKYIAKLDESGINVNEYSVMFLEKFSISFICIIFALVASIGAFRPNRRGSSFGKSLLVVFVFVILYWLINSYSIGLGQSGKINPYLACFGVPALFTLFLFYQFFKNRKLT